MKRIYVAGASKEVDMIEGFIAQLKAKGWHITHDWCAEIRALRTFMGVDKVLDADLSEDHRRKAAFADLEGVKTCDTLWLVYPKESVSRGCFVELGYALGMGVDIRPGIIVSGDDKKSIFTALADKHYATHLEALESL